MVLSAKDADDNNKDFAVVEKTTKALFRPERKRIMRYIYLRRPFHMKTDELKCFELALNDALHHPPLFPEFPGFVQVVQLTTGKTSIIQAFQITTDNDEIARATMAAILVMHRTIQLSWVKLYDVEAPQLEIECFDHLDDVPPWVEGKLFQIPPQEKEL